MSRYRDDTQETAVASSSTWAGIASIVEETAKTVTALTLGLLVMHAGAAVAADQVTDSARHVVAEQAAIEDTSTGQLRAVQLVNEQMGSADAVTHRLKVLHAEGAAAADEVVESYQGVTIETASASDLVIAARTVTSLVQESARISDFSGQAATELVEDQAVASDMVTGKARAKALVVELGLASDEVTDARQSDAQVTTERAVVSDLVVGHLSAANLVEEVAALEDAVLGGAYGQAWTANADSWAMSRYEPYSFIGLTVIDGKLYGMAEDGVYDLGVRGEVVSGEIRTGKLDVSSGALATPHAAYLEYELDGTAEMDVTTTQSGAAETYTYGLPPELAGELTNGRFVFGRGFRGRHFTFALRMTGAHGYINDLSVSTAQTKRRV